MWGEGDAAAALVGIYLGKHVVRWGIADGKKTWEGTLAMFATALICGMFVFVALKGMPPLNTLAAIAPTAAVSAIVELASKDGNDTVWVPLATVTMLSAFALLFA
jgi:dolichol kinase